MHQYSRAVNRKKIQWVTRTALLLALALLFQSLRLIFPGIPAGVNQFLVGTLVNLCLLLAAMLAGAWSGVAISVITPIVAFMQGGAPFIWMVPLIAAGNAALVLGAVFLGRKAAWVGMALGALAKFVILYWGIVAIGIPLFGVQDQAAALLSFSFSWPQLVTAALGGALALGIKPLLMRALEGDK
ncbi:Uncharacterised protein [uncultured Clostridium sp.]|nr:Uncharacterised protein [uncultured Clostridium sp.]